MACLVTDVVSIRLIYLTDFKLRGYLYERRDGTLVCWDGTLNGISPRMYVFHIYHIPFI